MLINNHPISSFSILFLSVLISACGGGGGGGGGGNGVDTPDPVLKGTVAAGAPMIGTVTVRDRWRVLNFAPIEYDGSYTMNLYGLEGPFHLMAEGTIGAKNYRFFSYAEQSDINGNVNITPFTDLIIANVRRTNEIYYSTPDYHPYDPTPSYIYDPSSTEIIDPVLIAAQETALQAKLQEVFTAVGVPGSIDLMRSTFLANHTGLDAALDIVQIEPSATSVMTLTNTVENTYLPDDITDPADGGVLAINNANAIAAFVADNQRITCSTQSGWNADADNGLGTPYWSYSFAEFETVLTDCGGAMTFSSSDIAGNTWISQEGESTSYASNGTGTYKSGVIGEPDINFTWTIENTVNHSYLVLNSDSSTNPDLPSGFSLRDTVALIGITGNSGTTGAQYTFVKYSEQSNYGDMVRTNGSDGAISKTTELFQ